MVFVRASLLRLDRSPATLEDSGSRAQTPALAVRMIYRLPRCLSALELEHSGIPRGIKPTVAPFLEKL